MSQSMFQLNRRHTLRAAWCAVLMASATVAMAQAPLPPYGTDITLEMARKISTAAREEAGKNNWRLAIAVVDTHGFLVHFERMADTQTSGPVIAVEKARTAAMFRRPSRVFEEGLAKRPAYLGLPGVTPVTGGLPIMVDGKVIGGIGASGASSDEDELAAKAGLQAGLQK